MNQKSDMFIEQYNKFAEDYTKAQAEFYSKCPDESRRAFYAQINPVKNKKLLDVGCGSGKDLLYFKEKGAHVYGIDASEKMIKLARENNPSLNLSVQKFEKTEFENKFFDIIVSRYALHYSSNLKKVFKELHRILKPEGVLIFLAAHPLLVFLAKRKGNYHEKEIVKIPLYGRKIIIQEPTHTFSEYFDDFVLKKFEILSFYENTGNENETMGSFGVVPDFFMLKLKKR